MKFKWMMNMQVFLKMQDMTKPVLAGLFVFCLMLNLGACSVAPSTIVKTPMTAKPEARAKNAASKGAIYQASSYRPLFEDRRARLMGDILTIRIVENTTANKAGTASSTRSGSIDASVTPPTGLPINLVKKPITLTAESELANDEASNQTASNNFNGSIAVTVIDVRENGYLEVSGEKQIAFDRGSEFVRFSGVINPDDILQGNNVNSNRVADAKMEYRTNSQLDAAQVISILSRFFLSISPI
jgi:flagellar L-ring protein FlgH